jgi:hypothetical protein
MDSRERNLVEKADGAARMVARKDIISNEKKRTKSTRTNKTKKV